MLSRVLKLTKIPVVETSFEEPELFIPERWTTAPELTMNKQAHMPFSLGKPISYYA